MDAAFVGGVCCWFGVLCENCIVDASISRDAACFCGWCCVCDVIFLFVYFVKFTCCCHMLAAWLRVVWFVCGGWCVRYLGRMVDALAC